MTPMEIDAPRATQLGTVIRDDTPPLWLRILLGAVIGGLIGWFLR